MATVEVIEGLGLIGKFERQARLFLIFGLMTLVAGPGLLVAQYFASRPNLAGLGFVIGLAIAVGVFVVAMAFKQGRLLIPDRFEVKGTMLAVVRRQAWGRTEHSSLAPLNRVAELPPVSSRDGSRMWGRLVSPDLPIPSWNAEMGVHLLPADILRVNLSAVDRLRPFLVSAAQSGSAH